MVKTHTFTSIVPRLFVAAAVIFYGITVDCNSPAAETMMVKNINTRQVPAPASGLVDVNGTLFFVVTDPNRAIGLSSESNGNELWKSDGTEAGTVLIKRFISIHTDFLAAVHDTLFFFAEDEMQGKGLWKSDGTSDGTVLVKKAIDPSTPAVSAEFAVTAGGTLFFRADDGTHGLELWKSDGTEAGTVMVKDINTSKESYDDSFPSSLTVVGETVYFYARDGVIDYTHEDLGWRVDLWKSDGTEQGTTMVKNVNHLPYLGVSTLSNTITQLNGRLYFFVDDGSQAWLWESGGTEDNTFPLKNLSSNSYDSSFFAGTKNILFFLNDGSLWRTDGTEAGTYLVTDIHPTTYGYLYKNKSSAVLNDVLYFAANDGKHGNELWRSDGTMDGTWLFKDLNTDPASGMGDPLEFTAVNNTLYFAADDGIHGRELWKTDGTVTGTLMVKDLTPDGKTDLSGLTSAGGMLYFPLLGAIWKSDGSETGTVLVKAETKEAGSVPRYFTDFKGQVYFSADDGLHGSELWKSNGTGEGTVLVKDIHPLNSSQPFFLTSAGSNLFFFAEDGSHGPELWKSDGTGAGTSLVMDINPEPGRGTSFLGPDYKPIGIKNTL